VNDKGLSDSANVSRGAPNGAVKRKWQVTNRNKRRNNTVLKDKDGNEEHMFNAKSAKVR